MVRKVPGVTNASGDTLTFESRHTFYRNVSTVDLFEPSMYVRCHGAGKLKTELVS